MIFLGKDEVQLLEKQFRHDQKEYGEPKFVLYCKSRPRDHATPAGLIAQSTGVFSVATVLHTFSMRNGWDEESTTPAWQRYRRWREANGDYRALYDAPAHQFGPDETGLLAETIAFALELGWDALVSLKPGRKLLLLSHDDRVEIYHGFNGGKLMRQLAALEYWRKA